ncbi:MAG TPA: delta-60 repeat domain-containing protein, partial [Actinomycetota bacterium]|nr:delta-60 repeat domain-containing protein [Actinomycetota bacterium]
MAIQSDGKIVAAGYTGTYPDEDFALARYTRAGALDNTFGGTGTITTPIGSSDDVAFAVAIQSDGKIVAAG